MIRKTFDVKKLTRALHKQPGGTERNPSSRAVRDNGCSDTLLSPHELLPCLRDVYVQILRHDTISIAGLDFGAIGEGDIDDLETVLYHSPANRLFVISDCFKRLTPSAARGRLFI